jgi:hypothetical protein
MKVSAASIRRNLRQSLAADVAYAKQRQAALRNHQLDDAFSTIAKVMVQAGKVSEYVRHNEWVYAEDMKLNSEVVIPVDSLKSDPVVNFLTWVDDNVAQIASSRDTACDWVARRTFKVTAGNLDLQISFDLPTSGDACHRVKTGVKLVEQATYAIACE